MTGFEGSLSVAWVVWKVVAFIVASFIFSAIFWWTHNKIGVHAKKRRK